MKLLKYLMSIAAVSAVSPFLQGQDAAVDEVPETAAAAVEEEAVPAENAPDMTDEQKKQLEIRLLGARKARIDAEVALGRARLSEELAQRGIERSRLEAETALRTARTAAKLAEIDTDKKKLDAVLARDKARNELAVAERSNRLRAAELDLEIARMERELTLAQSNRRISQVKMAETMRGIVPADAGTEYRKEPLENGKLYVSDRRIEFNGPVTPELASYVTERINFYNNQTSEYPIFIVIDASPGGSVLAGYRILKAMESSKAPVYVVVKNYAASMAAVITTLAERSFCYAGTVILHHQPSSGTKGNLTQMQEFLRQTTDWTRRINDKIAGKMGLSYEDYVAEMYKHNSRGDWSEFGDAARKWHWVTDVVDTIDESSFVRKGGNASSGFSPEKGLGQKIDERGKPYVELPTLPAGDLWMIYDPHNFYRVGA